MDIPVIDPFGVVKDPEMPTLTAVLDPRLIQCKFIQCLKHLFGEQALFHLQEIQVTRYKPKRRCVIEYKVKVEQPSVLTETVILIGKVRSKHRCRTAYQLLNKLWNTGFQAESPDGISVPESVGFIAEYNLWLQRKVPGQVATDLLTSSEGKVIVQRIAEAAYKLHHTDIPTKRTHTMSDELRILREKLPVVAEMKTGWADRIERILEASMALGAKVPDVEPKGIHRDFYSDQVLIDGARLYLIDFDLYCKGDPSLDIGNFIGHITEQGLRTLGNPEALVNIERTMEESFVELSGEKVRPAISAYATLTLVRHIYISTLFPERRQFTEALIEICEKRLNLNR